MFSPILSQKYLPDKEGISPTKKRALKEVVK